jgi:hypothetical protein
VIFDIRSKITRESTPYSVDVIRSRLAEELGKSHAKVKIEENGDTTWTASFIHFEFINIVAWELAGTDGRIEITTNSKEGVRITYHIKHRLLGVILLLICLTFLAWHLFGGLSADVLPFPLIMCVIYYLYIQIYRRWWFRGFIGRQI